MPLRYQNRHLLMPLEQIHNPIRALSQKERKSRFPRRSSTLWRRRLRPTLRQIDGCLMDEEIAQSEQSNQLIALVEAITILASGEGIGAEIALRGLIEAKDRILNFEDDIAHKELDSRKGRIAGRDLARTTHALVSRSPFQAGLRRTKCPHPLKRNRAYWQAIKALFSKKDLRLRGSSETQLVLEALSHFSGVYQFALVAQHLKGYTLSKEEKLVLKHEKVFSSEEQLSKGEADATFQEMILPWLVNHHAGGNYLDLYKQSWRTIVISRRRKSQNAAP